MTNNLKPVNLLFFVIFFSLLSTCHQETSMTITPIEPIGSPSNIEDGQIVNKALVLKKGEAPRRNTNSVEKRIIKNNFKKPTPRAKVNFLKDETNTWKKIKSDSCGWFKDKALQNAYVYISLNMDKKQMILLEGMGHRMVYVNGKPRIGNKYQLNDESKPWEPQYGYSLMPILLKKGRNNLLFSCTRGKLKIKFHRPRSAVMLNTEDPTLPDFKVGEKINKQAAVVIINGTQTSKDNLKITSNGSSLESTKTKIPAIPPMSIRKVPFRIIGSSPKTSGKRRVKLKLIKNQNIIDTSSVNFSVKKSGQSYKNTFISDIDGSLQYYAVNPGQNEVKKRAKNALILSVHGAAVEASNQASSYRGKDWAQIVCPTNRRPYGYDWEKWGRLDALEVLNIAKRKFQIDPNQIYLTGHSMGGHGTWYLGTTYPDKWAAIGPSAGWISFWTYVFGKYKNSTSPSQKMILRSSRSSDVYGLVNNLKNKGVYIIHGKEDKVVSPNQAYQMIDTLKKYNINYRSHFEPNAGHWWDKSDEPGADCVDWPPLFDYFARHRLPSNKQLRNIDFTTANPEISAWSHWLGIIAQENQLKLSTANFRWNPGSNGFVGKTKNVKRLSFKLGHIESKDTLYVKIDGQKIDGIKYPQNSNKLWFEKEQKEGWNKINKPPTRQKGPHRYGTFQSAFNHRFLFIYSTKGNKLENKWSYNKARFDAETFWYQGNGSIDIIPDTLYKAKKYKDRGVIIYGNSETNAAWNNLLSDSPIQVNRNGVSIGDREIKGKDLSCLFIRPKPNSKTASVGVVAGSGIVGMRATYDKLYMYPGYNYPDITVSDFSKSDGKSSGVIVSGFFGLDWSLKNADIKWDYKKE